jgi:DNA-directed RNA polymerase subunit RPC12/RpoP
MIECNTKCNSCGYKFRLSIGGTMRAYELRCNICGKSILVMRKGSSCLGDDEIANAEKIARKCRSIDIETIENGNMLFSD